MSNKLSFQKTASNYGGFEAVIAGGALASRELTSPDLGRKFFGAIGHGDTSTAVLDQFANKGGKAKVEIALDRPPLATQDLEAEGGKYESLGRRFGMAAKAKAVAKPPRDTDKRNTIRKTQANKLIK